LGSTIMGFHLMNYCKKCAIPILSQWQGWPLWKPVPLLPRVRNGSCDACGYQVEVVLSTEIQWLNYHGPYNTGLPDYWLLVTDQTTVWGLPYHSETVCDRCGGRAVLSEHGDSRSGRFEYKAGCPSCYEEESKRKQEELQRQQDIEAMHQRERQDYFQSLAAMSLEKRITTIAEDKSIDPYRNWREWNGWKSEWGRYSDGDIAALNAESTQHLIDLCESNSVLRSLGVLQSLYDRRHHLRQVAMDEIRRKYAAISPQDQLTELVVATTTPISNFPIELASAVTINWLDTIPEIKRVDFLSQLSTCKLRAWVRAHQRLSNSASPNPAVHTDAAR